LPCKKSASEKEADFLCFAVEGDSPIQAFFALCICQSFFSFTFLKKHLDSSMALHAKKILLGITGSIAAYKSATLTRLLVKQGAEVQVLMTEAAATFITPLTLATLSKNPVLIDFQKDKSGVWNNHVDLGLWADALLIAPASAQSLAKAAQGLCDNLLMATYLSAKCPVLFAPAMDLDMYRHPAVQHNLHLLRQYGHRVIPAAHGELASGLVGEGRMAEPEEIVAYLQAFFAQEEVLQGKTVLITAGPTMEPIDPVRFISNHSTGKMGYAIAQNLAEKGAKVHLISGKTALPAPQHPNIHFESVMSAEDMYQAAHKLFPKADAAILAAAVADYKPATFENQKIKKKSDDMHLALAKTIDIAQALGKEKQPRQRIVGFALETNNELQHAQDKLQRKNFDMIVLNSLQDSGAGFGHDTNKVSFLFAKGNPQHFALKSKQEVAEDIVQALIGLFQEENL